MSASESEDEMASFMGFSTFGKAPAPKKRKFNPSTDAFIDGEELDARKIDRGGKKGKGSGGNEVPLGKVRTVGGGRETGLGAGIGGLGKRMDLPAPVVKEDEEEERGVGGGFGRGMNLPPPRIALRASPPRELEEGAAYMDTSLPPPIDGPAYMDTSLPPPIDGPAYMDTSLPPPASEPSAEIDSAEAAEMQERIDRIMASIQPPPGGEDYPPPPPTPVSAPKAGFSQENQGFGRVTGLPSRPPASFQNSNSAGGGRGRGMSDAGSSVSGSGFGNGRQRGERNEEWYVGYYDPAFNENPWEKLEKERKLVSLGSWVERPKREVR